jgi:hypothetical protein
MREEGSLVAPPTLVALLICDQIIDDRLTNKKSAIGLFNTVLVPAVPTRIHQLTILAALTEITAKTPLELRLVRDSDTAVLMATQGFVEAPNPLATVDLVFSMQGIHIPTAGQYAFELLAVGEPLGRRRFQVLVGPRPGRAPGAADAEPPPSEPAQ